MNESVKALSLIQRDNKLWNASSRRINQRMSRMSYPLVPKISALLPIHKANPWRFLRGVVALRDDRRICFAPYQAPERLNLVLILKRRNPWEYIKKDILRSWCHLHRLSIFFFVLVMSILVFFNQAIAGQQTPRIR